MFRYNQCAYDARSETTKNNVHLMYRKAVKVRYDAGYLLRTLCKMSVSPDSLTNPDLVHKTQ